LYRFAKQTNKVSQNVSGSPGALMYQWATTTSISYNRHTGQATPSTQNTGTLPPDDLMAHLLSQVYQTQNEVLEDTQTDYHTYQRWQSLPGIGYDVVSEQFNEERFQNPYTVDEAKSDFDSLVVDYEYLAAMARTYPDVKLIVRRTLGNGSIQTDLYDTVLMDIGEARPADYFGNGKIVVVQALHNWTANNMIQNRQTIWGPYDNVEGIWESVSSIKFRTTPRNYLTKTWERCGAYGQWNTVNDTRTGDVYYSVSTPGVQAVEHSG
jgi:hypothetical protein